MNLSERIKKARKAAGLTQAQLAELVGIAQTAVSQLESGKTLRSSYLIQIARECGVNSNWLASGEGDMKDPEDFRKLGMALVKELFSGEHEDDAVANLALRGRLETLRAARDIVPSDFGAVEIPYLIELDNPDEPGKTIVEKSAVASLMFNEHALEKQHVLPNKAVAAVVVGNSMAPVLSDGSSVVANTDETGVVDGKIYVIDHGGQIRIKILHRLPGAGIRIRSYNQLEYADEIYTQQEMAESGINIVGRVFWGASFF
ncbi:XRE family transcriptional regulator [Pseudomonas fluorescens]|uniref:HTH-type transcriptional regulator PrtR n=1 Tax=Pseudomonas fluorescens TaxID=294 RepID=A0A5E7EDI9_PSEFL|nr:S24 family peptidase [Pseudomonas fluorescens]VVO24407.1 HTH-type transcriptional regulator PrtR [Pseudomonas fluorescens]